jgi:CRAL/TRIO domain
MLALASTAAAPGPRQVPLLLQGQFPERLSQLWFLNAPFIFWGLWRIVSPFIEVATREKIVFLTGAERAACLQEAIPPEVSLRRRCSSEHDPLPADDDSARCQALMACWLMYTTESLSCSN